MSHTKYAQAYKTQTVNMWMAWELPITYKAFQFLHRGMLFFFFC